MYADLINSSEHFGNHKDGTLRKKKDSGKFTYTVKFRCAAPWLSTCCHCLNCARVITSTVQTVLSEVSSCGKLSYVMSERAANEKLSNHQITEWKDDLLKEFDGEEDRTTIYSFYCMVLVLLGYHSYASKPYSERVRR
ncbi:hypothetical protein SNE40_020004 [Patella caerulea]|uniref:Uncharacterized protein n=1 Tax=Patella caerulea TaxID=87958 RepID=A0AAN8J4J5_PATCE